MGFAKGDININRLGRPQGSTNLLTREMRDIASNVLCLINVDRLNDRDKIKLLDVLLRHSNRSSFADFMSSNDIELKFDFDVL